MMRRMRRQQRKIAMALLLLNVSGARAISVSDPCERGRVFFSAGLGFKAITKTVMHQSWKQTTQNALGERTVRYTANDMATIQRGSKVVAIITQAATTVALDTRTPRAGSLYAWKLPTDLHQVQPPHLLI